VVACLTEKANRPRSRFQPDQFSVHPVCQVGETCQLIGSVVLGIRSDPRQCCIGVPLRRRGPRRRDYRAPQSPVRPRYREQSNQQPPRRAQPTLRVKVDPTASLQLPAIGNSGVAAVQRYPGLHVLAPVGPDRLTPGGMGGSKVRDLSGRAEVITGDSADPSAPCPNRSSRTRERFLSSPVGRPPPDPGRTTLVYAAGQR